MALSLVIGDFELRSDHLLVQPLVIRHPAELASKTLLLTIKGRQLLSKDHVRKVKSTVLLVVAVVLAFARSLQPAKVRGSWNFGAWGRGRRCDSYFLPHR